MMSSLRPKRISLKAGVALALVAGGLSIGSTVYNDFEISKNLDIFATLFRQLNVNYADEINPGRLTKVAIDAMLGSLDPYTVYIPEADIEDYRMAQGGQSGSVGFQVHLRDGKHVIVSMVNNSAAMSAGLLVGDILLQVEGNPIEGRSAEEVNQLLGGQAGSKIKVKVQRPYREEVIEKELERAYVKEQTIPWSGMPAEKIAYVSLKTFSQNAASEVKEAYLKLTSSEEVKGMILDLRGNGGGLLLEAVNLSNLFVKQNEMIVSTRGRIADRNRTYRTHGSPFDMEIPVVVLIDDLSASASEIVAGALQDLDRAVIIGQRSFGKGLVQNVVPLVFNAQLKVTIAKYYIPSGRCIQAVDYFDPTGTHQIPDSLISTFKTRNGRKVTDGKGIIPDIQIDKPQLSAMGKALVSSYMIFDFATRFRVNNATIAAPEDFEITGGIWNEFVSFLTERGFSYQTSSEDKLRELLTAVERDGYQPLLEQELNALSNSLKTFKKEDLQRNKSEISQLLKREIIYRYYFDTGQVKAGLVSDRELVEAYRILGDPAAFRSMISGGYRPL
jgi:carboxyl-terminal processing protease